MKWEDNILGFVPRKDWLDVPFQITRQGDPIDGLFGDQKTANLVAEWESLASEYQVPMMAQFHGFDTEAETTFRAPIDTHNIEKGLIKVKINQSERMRALLRSGVQGDETLYDYVINDGLRLAEQVVTRTKVAKNEVLATGKLTIKENNLDLEVDYGVPAANLALTLDVGDGATDDLPSQLQDIVDNALANGVTLTGFVTSGKTVSKMRKNLAIQKAIHGEYGAGQLLSNSELRDYLLNEFGLSQIVTNDLTYGASASYGADGRPIIQTARYFPKDKVSFISTNVGGSIGVGLWGDPPEMDSDVMRYLDGNASGYNPYVWITQWAENDPAVLWTKASTLFIPVLYNPTALYVATVTDTPADGA